MSKSANLLIAACLLGGVIVAPSFARAQVGSALSNNPLLHQGDVRAGVDDINKRAQQETPYRVVKDVKKALEDADPKVRVAGLEKLRFIQHEEVTGLLLQGLSDPDVRVKVKATDLLGARQVTDAVPAMSQYLFLRSTEPVVKLHVVAALGRIGDVRGVLPVLQYLKEVTDERNRGTAVFALGEIADPQATSELSQIATEDKSPTVRRLASEAMEKIEGELPTEHSAKVAAELAKKNEPTDQRLSKLREIDEELQKAQH